MSQVTIRNLYSPFGYLAVFVALVNNSNTHPVAEAKTLGVILDSLLLHAKYLMHQQDLLFILLNKILCLYAYFHLYYCNLV